MKQHKNHQAYYRHFTPTISQKYFLQMIYIGYFQQSIFGQIAHNNYGNEYKIPHWRLSLEADCCPKTSTADRQYLR